MDWTRIAKVAKALTAGCTGAVTAAAGVAAVYAAAPGTSAMPGWLWTALPIGAASFGFIAGFATTFAVKNAPPSPTATQPKGS